MIFLFDNNFSFRLVRVLQALDVDAVALRDVFPPDVPDTVFLSWLATQDGILVTCDRRITTRRAEAKALKQSGVSAIFIGRFFPKKDLWGQAGWLVNNWKRIELHITQSSQGSYVLVPERGRIRRLTL